MKTAFCLTAVILISGILSGCNKSQPVKNTSPTPVPTQVIINPKITPTTDSLGFNFYSVQKLKLSFFSPPEWLISYDSVSNPNYIEVSKQSSIVQIFYNQNLAHSLTDEQKAKAFQTTNKVIKIDGRQISADETELQGGGMVMTVNLPAQGKKPALTIWFTTDNRAQYRDSILHMLETLSLN